MNERIQNIYQRSFSIYQTAVGFGEPKTVERFDLEKFAELIVRECAQVMKAEGEQFSLDQNFDAVKGVGRCMRKVKEHFGVEE